MIVQRHPSQQHISFWLLEGFGLVLIVVVYWTACMGAGLVLRRSVCNQFDMKHFCGALSSLTAWSFTSFGSRQYVSSSLAIFCSFKMRRVSCLVQSSGTETTASTVVNGSSQTGLPVPSLWRKLRLSEKASTRKIWQVGPLHNFSSNKSRKGIRLSAWWCSVKDQCWLSRFQGWGGSAWALLWCYSGCTWPLLASCLLWEGEVFAKNGMPTGNKGKDVTRRLKIEMLRTLFISTVPGSPYCR
jgi:hypothetical protein